MRPRDQLRGLTLDGGWTVVEKFVRTADETGGNFSCGYVVRSPDGRPYFLKAIDYSRALLSKDPARELQRLTEAFNFERDALEIGKRLSCIVTNVADGAVVVNPSDPNSVVQYLIFELAEESVRAAVFKADKLPMSTCFLVLRRVATALRQLHQNQIAHQDTKPSNVLRFSGDEYKLADLGRASIKGRIAPHDIWPIAGDPDYSPPELLYSQVHPDFNVRRLACDLYMLGGLATYLVTQVSMTALILRHLHSTARPIEWHGTYDQVLPQVRAAYGKAIADIKSGMDANASYSAELATCIEQLCEPDPTLRGHPNSRLDVSVGGNTYDLQRYISQFDRLNFKARVHEARTGRR